MEDPFLWGIIARSLERIIAVVFGGLGIYYGYRLFQLLPTQKDNSGKIELPGISVVLSKAGPGVFFVAFGTVILLSTFFNPVVIRPDEVYGAASYTGLTSPVPSSHGGTEQNIARVRLDIQVLNCALQANNTSRSHIKTDDMQISITDAKLALLARVWNKQKWGEYDAFYKSLRTGNLDKSLPVAKIFNGGLPGCGKGG